MCGFIGIWLENPEAGEYLSEKAGRMADTLIHRGPDDSGIWMDAEAGLALAFRRLSIIDLSPLGHQPMQSASGRYIIAFNGEVYNFSALRSELETAGHAFRGQSDTEVILAAFEEWGILEAVKRFVGMFAIAVWDRNSRRLTLVRDRLGIKPLYYGWNGGAFLCGSELKALRAYSGFIPQVDRGALCLYLRHMYIPSPYSIYQGIYKLPPGCLLQVNSPLKAAPPEPAAYWSAREIAASGVAHRFDGSEDEAINRLDELLRDAVRLRMVADVPLGAFLSGGIDSSLVVGMMQAQSSRPVRTFTIGFHEPKYNEAEYAKAIAGHLGTDHTEIYVAPADAEKVIPRIPEIFDEPFADSSQIPTFLVSELTRRYVTVSLSGDGGDEIFGGYHQYRSNDLRWRVERWCPAGIRKKLGKVLLALVGDASAHSRSRLGYSLAARLRLEGRLLAAEGGQAMYRAYVSEIDNPKDVVLGGWEAPYTLTNALQDLNLPSFAEQMMYYDITTYMVDDILTKVDRTSMAVSLEARVPLLDHRVVEFAWRLPYQWKIREGQGKWILRQALYRYVPKELVNRPKKGFSVPIGAWLRGPLHDWAESLLDEKTLRDDGFLQADIVRSWWKRFQLGEYQLQSRLWLILMFQAWKDRWFS